MISSALLRFVEALRVRPFGVEWINEFPQRIFSLISVTGVLVFVLNWSPTPATGIAVYDRVDTASRLMSFTNVFATTVYDGRYDGRVESAHV